MSEITKGKSGIRILPYLLFTMGVLALPLIGMLISEDVNWGLFDFIFIGVLLFSAGMIYEFVSKRLVNRDHLFVAAIVIMTLVLYIWAEAAVGIFTNWGN